MLPLALHAFEVEIERAAVVVELGEEPRVDGVVVPSADEAVRDRLATGTAPGLAVLAAPRDLSVEALGAVGRPLSEAGWRVLIAVDDAEPSSPPSGSASWVTLSRPHSVAGLVSRIDGYVVEGHACVRVDPGPDLGPVAGAVDLPTSGPVSVLEIRFGGTRFDAWHTLAGGGCQPGGTSSLHVILKGGRATLHPGGAPTAHTTRMLQEADRQVATLSGCGVHDAKVAVQGGEITDVSVAGDDTAAERCIAEGTRHWTWPVDDHRVLIEFQTEP